MTGLLLSGCSLGGYPEIPNDPVGGGGPGSATGGSSGSSGVAGGSGGAGASAGVSPVLVGITPTPDAQGGAPTAADEVEASLVVLGAGARAAVLSVPWDGDAASESAKLAKKTQFAAAHKASVALRLLVVERSLDRRPAQVAGLAWNAPETLEAAKEAIDLLLSASGEEVRYLAFGRDVDVYLAAHPDERAGFVAFAKETCAYAKAHADAPKSLGVGVGLSADAPKMEPAFKDLVDFQDVLPFSYLPGLGTFEPEAASGAYAALTQIADAAGKKPIVLLDVGFASDGAAGGGEDAQQQLFATLFGLVSARRESFALVNVVELHDALPAACAAWAEEQGEMPDGPLAAYACSLGLFRADGTPRPAWSAVLSGSAALSTP